MSSPGAGPAETALKPESAVTKRGDVFRNIASRPHWAAAAGLLMALIALTLRLGSAGDGALVQWVSSDTLWLVDVFVDVFHDGYSISGWKFSIAPFWFPDVFVTGMFWFLTRNPILATLLAGFAQVFAIVFAFHLLSRALGRRSVLQDTCLFVVSAAIALFVAVHPGLIYPNFVLLLLPEGHVGNMILVICAWALALGIIRSRRRGFRANLRVLAVYSTICLLAGMSNLFFFPHMLVSLTVAVALAIFLGFLKWRDCVLTLAAGWGSACVGAVLNRVLFNAADVGVQSNLGIEPALIALNVFMRGFLGKLFAFELLHICAVLWAAVCIGYLAFFVRRGIQRGRAAVGEREFLTAMFFTMALTASVVSVVSVVAGGSNGLVEFKDYEWTMHYLHQTFFLPLFGLVAAACWALDHLLSRKALAAGSWLVAAVGLSVTLIGLVASPVPNVPIYSYRPPVVRLVDKIAQGRTIRYGYSGYWQARIISLLSTAHVRAYAVKGDLEPFIWANNTQWYTQSLEDRTKPPQISFVVLDDPLWRITREEAVHALGQPVAEAEGDGIHVLLYH